MIKAVQCGEEYRITFPYDARIVRLVKEVMGRQWHPEGKFWSIPKDNLGLFIAHFKGTEFEDMVSIYSNESINVNQSLDDTKVEIPDYKLNGIKTYVKDGAKLYNHQLDFLRFALHRQANGNDNGFVVCDTMGLGKTIEAINLAIHNKSKYGYKHCLILCCINMSKYNWQKEIEVHTNGKYEGYIIGSRRYKRKDGINYNGSSFDKLEDLRIGHMYGNKSESKLPYFIILNVEAIRYEVMKGSSRKKPIADELISMINGGDLGMVVIDEVHKNLSAQSQQGKQLLRIKKSTGNGCMWLPMTGTPIVNKPTDLFLPLRLVNAHAENAYSRWTKEFCVYGGFGGHEIIGYKNIKKLKFLLHNNMIRRLKEDVLDLPDKIQMVEYVENTPYQDKLYKEIEEEIWANREEIMSSLNPLSKMLRLRQVNGSPEILDLDLKLDSKYLSKNAKMKRLLELVEDITSNDEKVIVFSNWVEPLRTIYKFLATKYKVCTFTGTMSEKERERHKQIFMTDDSYKVMLGTIWALGTTHTLTAANNIIFYDEAWTPSDKEQAEDRIHRVGTTKTANIYTLVTKDTIDDRVHDIVYSKGLVSNFIVDNKIDIYNNPDLFYQLMGREK